MNQDDSGIPEVFRRAMEEMGWRTEEGEGGRGEPPRRPTTDQPAAPRRGRLLLVLGILLLLLLSIRGIATFYTDWLWFDHLGFAEVFTRRLTTRVALFVVGFLAAAAFLLLNWLLARRRAQRGSTTTETDILRSRGMTLLIVGLALLLATFFGSSAAAQWTGILRYLNRVPFELADPLFGRDVGFYIFELPVLEFVQSWVISLLLVTMLGLVPIYLIGNLNAMRRDNIRALYSTQFRTHFFTLAAVFALAWAASYWLDIYRLLYSPRGVAFGASYTDIAATLWALRLQIVLAVLMAALLLVNIVRYMPRVLLGMAGLWIAVSVIGGSIIPGLLQRYSVEPNELTLETPYIEHNIAFTRAAFKLNEIENRSFGDVRDLSAEDLLQNEATLRNIRLWDYRPLQQTYQQLQALRPYYTFADVDIDRYEIDGVSRQVMLSARELDKTRLPAPSWVNEHLEFTHGYGLVMNPVDEITREGQPQFFIEDLPPRSTIPLSVDRPEVYFGELTNDVVYVGGGRREFSYPSGEENVYTSYDGTGGVRLDSFLKRLAFAIRENDANVLLTSDINDNTRILFNRQIQQRIRTITPYLTLDQDPYLVVNEGRLVWIQNAYTTSRDYPYSTPITVPAAAGGVGETPWSQPTVNYMRNAVMITIDAYDGNISYYIVDEEDPIIRSYARIFPGVFKPLAEMPDSLRPHFRYPVDFFAVQTRQYLTYHMTDPRVFYNKEDLWQIPNELYGDAEMPIEPYYVALPLPGQAEPEYLLIMPLSPATKNNMIAWLAARNDPEHYGELIVYDLPKQQLIYGPLQVEGRINQDAVISQQFSLWDQRGSSVIRGNLLVLPFNQSFLYIEPIYLLSSTNALPELKRIIAATNTSIAMEETLEQALIALDRAPSSSSAGVLVEPPTGVGPTVPADATVEGLVAAANTHLLAAEEAQRTGDWATYGEELALLRETLAQLAVLTGTVP